MELLCVAVEKKGLGWDYWFIPIPASPELNSLVIHSVQPQLYQAGHSYQFALPIQKADTEVK